MFINPNSNKSSYRYLWVLLGIFVILVLTVGIVYVRWKDSWLTWSRQTVENFVVQQVKNVATNNPENNFLSLMPDLLGFDEPKTFLITFLNNDELRPGGGFIGVYGIVRANRASYEILEINGTETLDRGTPDSWQPVPPQPIKDYLGVSRWYFRDSNWSPDFTVNAQRALEFYQGEGGKFVGEIDAVLGITPTAVAEMMKITGPFTIEGINFTPDNLAEKLEYEVEYGHMEKGGEFEQRKNIMGPLVSTMAERIKDTLFRYSGRYLATSKELIKNKQVMIYDIDAEKQKKISALGLSGEVKSIQSGEDYLLWVDANLGALKTDYAIKRNLNYSFDNNYVVSVVMVYEHTGKFDWRTSRYQNYARIFVPLGSELIEVVGNTPRYNSDKMPTIDQGEENGKKWFGTFISIEPGKKGELVFKYKLPEKIVENIKNGTYTLVVQKQAGVPVVGLTFGLDFGKRVTSAIPGEIEDKWGDTRYDWGGELIEDREFSVSF